MKGVVIVSGFDSRRLQYSPRGGQQEGNKPTSRFLGSTYLAGAHARRASYATLRFWIGLDRAVELTRQAAAALGRRAGA